MTDHWWLYLWVFPVGLVVGSFLNVCVFRLPDGQSVVSPRSQCPSCQQPIAWFDNIPLISYIWLGRRCRHCQASISLRYPVIELMNGLGYMGIVATFGWTWAAGVYAVFFSALLVVAWIDLDHFIIPDVISLPGIVIGLLAAATILPIGLVNAVIGVVLGGGILWVLAILSPYMFGKEGLGGGDIKLLAMIGAFLGWQSALLTLMLASVTGAVVGIGLLVCKVMERGHYIPFGPFLVFGALVSLFFKAELVQWYIRTMW
jgi:leader peptidase (prepilin peptidase) / N-methyltransferase